MVKVPPLPWDEEEISSSAGIQSPGNLWGEGATTVTPVEQTVPEITSVGDIGQSASDGFRDANRVVGDINEQLNGSTIDQQGNRKADPALLQELQRVEALAAQADALGLDHKIDTGLIADIRNSGVISPAAEQQLTRLSTEAQATEAGMMQQQIAGGLAGAVLPMAGGMLAAMAMPGNLAASGALAAVGAVKGSLSMLMDRNADGSWNLADVPEALQFTEKVLPLNTAGMQQQEQYVSK